MTIPNLIFTRYLYKKQSVEIALMMSLLEKKTEEALFWGYELYHSGFRKELFELFIKIYYDFYACLNQSFGTFLMVKYNEYLIENNFLEDRVVSMIINNFITRPYNLDVFTLRCFVSINKKNNIKKILFKEMLENKDFENITSYVYSLKEKDIKKNIEIIIEYFEKMVKINKNLFKQLDNCKKYNISTLDMKTILLSIILHLYSLFNNMKMGKNIYVIVQPEEVIKYNTIIIKPCYKVLSNVCLYSVDESKYLDLFEMNNNQNINIINAYLNEWLYYSSFSPIWNQRIDSFKGRINHDKKCVIFPNDDLEEAFYEEFNYEPDEQKKEVQAKSIPSINNVNIVSKHSWIQFYNSFHNNSLLRKNLVKNPVPNEII
jgi:hypothetical protein